MARPIILLFGLLSHILLLLWKLCLYSVCYFHLVVEFSPGKISYCGSFFYLLTCLNQSTLGILASYGHNL